MFNIISCGFRPFNVEDPWGFLSLKDKDGTMAKSYRDMIRLIEQRITDSWASDHVEGDT